MPGKTFGVEECIRRCREVHPQYNYDNTIFIDTRTKINVVCPEHGEFKVLYWNLIRGQQCKKCQTYNKLTLEQCISDFRKAHKFRYDYSKFIYNGNAIKSIVICKDHGEFEVSPNHHKRGKGCPYCANKKITTETFIEKAKLKHKDKFDYSLVEYKKNNLKINIICNKCGTIFLITPHDHLNGNGCSFCKASTGEIRIENWLKENNIHFVSQKRFEQCRNKNPLPFDFYLPDNNICIEYDGIHHFEQINRSSSSEKNKEQFEITQKHDKIKNDFCMSNNITLLRISYLEKDNIENILKNFLL